MRDFLPSPGLVTDPYDAPGLVDAPSGVSETITFYAAATSGGTVNVLNTVVIENGLITSWEQSTGGGGGGTSGTPIGLLLALTYA